MLSNDVGTGAEILNISAISERIFILFSFS